MFIPDDILMAPIHGLMRIFREIREAAARELVDKAESLTERRVRAVIASPCRLRRLLDSSYPCRFFTLRTISTVTDRF